MENRLSLHVVQYLWASEVKHIKPGSNRVRKEVISVYLFIYDTIGFLKDKPNKRIIFKDEHYSDQIPCSAESLNIPHSLCQNYFQ